MRYALSLTRRAAVAVAAGTLAAGALLFTAGALVGASAADGRHALAQARTDTAADSAAAGRPAADSAESLTGFAPADCPPAAPAEATSYTAARHLRTAVPPPAPSARPAPSASVDVDADAPRLVRGRTVGTFRDERRALTARGRYEAIGVEAVIEAWAGADGEPVFRVVTAEAP